MESLPCKEFYPAEDKKVRNVSVIVPPPSPALSKGLDYPKNLVEYVNNLIVIAASDHSEIEALGGSVKLLRGCLAPLTSTNTIQSSHVSNPIF